MRVRKAKAVCILAILLMAIPASASIIGVTGNVVNAGLIPADLTHDVVTPAPSINVYLEASGYVLGSTVAGIAPGTYDIYFVHFDQFPNGANAVSNGSGTVSFLTNVAGLVGDYAGLDAWDALLPGTTFETGSYGSPYFRQMDTVSPNHNDVFTYAGNTVTLDLQVTDQGMDQGRIFVNQVPEPATFLLLGVGLLSLGLLKRRRAA